MMQKKVAFDEWMQQRQIDWRNAPENKVDRGEGWQNNRHYAWILPKPKWEQGLWPGIRSGSATPLADYLGDEIHAHTGRHNLKSSWVHCANLYFPFGNTAEGNALLAGFLSEHVSPDVQTVDELHLEYAETEGSALHPSNLLGEKDGHRGSGQTSPDLAFHVNGRKGLILVENKLTEHYFYRCSARAKTGSDERPANPAPERCEKVAAILTNHRDHCHQCKWGRKYWDILHPVVNRAAVSALNRCPAATAGYQLFRQQALAEGIARGKRSDGTHYDFVYSCVALDDRNEALKNCLKNTGITDLQCGWSALWNSDAKARFKTFTHQQWVSHVRNNAEKTWRDWLAYVTDRYGY